ncbi:probable adenylate kinase 7, mitochondrial [Olea europaea subsp. europaea]|uniref:adenylate kinase n=1 Tax=Olea europaea subsp. europaea TaxID=158383 RepID=A0A8S0PGC6_OLEEU|nr:probable adenylate kinase 7, mitochondrial [Olea europaea subsp. europaea]
MTVLSRLRTVVQPLVFRLSLNKSQQAYGSAAAAQLDYDYYNDEDEEPQGKGNRRAMQEATPLEEGWDTVGRGAQWVIMGDPMARQHMYAERLSKILDVPHISMGNLVRQELHPHSSLYKQIAGAVNQGKLVPEDVIFGLLSKKLEECYCRGETGFVLDGIPRTQIQAEILDQISNIDLVLNLKCTDDCLVKKSPGNGIYTPPEHHCMACSGFDPSFQPQNDPLRSSNADTDTAWKEKFRVNAEQRKPLEEYYKKQCKLVDFQVSDAPGDTWRGLLGVLHLQDTKDLGSAV